MLHGSYTLTQSAKASENSTKNTKSLKFPDAAIKNKLYLLLRFPFKTECSNHVSKGMRYRKPFEAALWNSKLFFSKFVFTQLVIVNRFALQCCAFLTF